MHYGYIGDKILELIENNNLTQREFAKTMGVYPSTVSQWISQEREPRISTIVKICENYNVSADWLLGTEKCKC